MSGSLRVVLVTSQVTYIPRNYQDVFEALLEHSARHIGGLILLENLSLNLLATALRLFTLGCSGLGRSLLQNIAALPLKRRERLFEKHGIPVLRARNMNDAAVIAWINEQHADLVVNMRTRCIFHRDALAAPKLGCLNIHHGLLPENRGTMCDLFALADARPAGFSIHRMTERLDDGQILLKRVVSDGAQPEDKHYLRYLSRTGKIEGNALAELIEKIAESNKLPPGEQNRCPDARYFKTPRTRGAVRELRAKGMIL